METPSEQLETLVPVPPSTEIVENLNAPKLIKFIRIILLILIIFGIGLLLTQSLWVPKLVKVILKSEDNQETLITAPTKLPITVTNPSQNQNRSTSTLGASHVATSTPLQNIQNPETSSSTDMCFKSDCWGHFGCNYYICTRSDETTYIRMTN